MSSRRGRRRATLCPVGLLAAALFTTLTASPGSMAQQRPDPFEDQRLEAALPQAFALYRDLLRLPNDAHHPQDILRLVTWLESAFAERGFASERLPTAGSPLLLARRSTPGATHTALVYLQADGQPVDPAAWDQPDPFDPVLKERAEDGSWQAIPWESLAGPRDPEWRVFARSASDSKGPVAQFLSALSLLDAAGESPSVDLKVIVDSEEELGSPHLPEAVERFRDRLAADFLVIFDGPPHVSGRPTLVFGARGIATATLTTWGPRVPQHSGHYGNYVPNPALRLAQLLASMKDAEGRVTIPGWYDGVELSEQVRAVLAAVPDDEAQIRRQLGIATAEAVAPTLQEAIQYPSLNVRGLRSAWVGEEVRTIIPATAVAELDIRLVVESDPQRLLRLLREHVEGQGYVVLDREPSDAERLRHARLATLETRVSYGAFRTEYDSLPGRWLTRALTRRHGEPPVRVRTFGGSIPIAPFVATLGIPAVVVPTVNPDNNQHSPNENLRLGDFVAGIRTIAAVLAEPVATER
ncbi:MAG TPA: M20/M25/M40 family metallo-hydrolase [Thermoanaerobaculia bacterium]|nr:M20/M25/M40 family metallo-hydrolase [Thermoanaerobaculia bacterium]